MSLRSTKVDSKKGGILNVSERANANPYSLNRPLSVGHAQYGRPLIKKNLELSDRGSDHVVPSVSNGDKSDKN